MSKKRILASKSEVLACRTGFKTKFDPRFIEISGKLSQLGATDEEIGYALNVAAGTVRDWKRWIAAFRRACGDGRSAMKKRMIAQGFKSAVGYDYEEWNEKWVPTGEVDDSGEPIYELKERSVFHRHQKPEPNLLMFMLSNLSDGAWQHHRSLNVRQQTMDLRLDVKASLTAEEIGRLAGKLSDMAREARGGRRSEDREANNLGDTVGPHRLDSGSAGGRGDGNVGQTEGSEAVEQAN